MDVKKLIAGSVIAGGLGATALGAGAGVAYAKPHPPGPGPGHHHDVGHGRPGVQGRGQGAWDRAVRDHRPFVYRGQRVTPVFDRGYRGWGFWLGPVWVPLR